MVSKAHGTGSVSVCVCLHVHMAVHVHVHIVSAEVSRFRPLFWGTGSH